MVAVADNNRVEAEEETGAVEVEVDKDREVVEEAMAAGDNREAAMVEEDKAEIVEEEATVAEVEKSLAGEEDDRQKALEHIKDENGDPHGFPADTKNVGGADVAASVVTNIDAFQSSFYFV